MHFACCVLYIPVETIVRNQQTAASRTKQFEADVSHHIAHVYAM